MTLTAAIKLDIQGFLQPLVQARQALTQLAGQARSAVIPIRAEGANEAAAGLRSVGAARKDLETGGSGGLSGLTGALKSASEGAGVLKGALSTAAGVVLGGAIESLAGGIAGIGKAMLDSNAEFERYTVQLTTLTGSSLKAKATLKELADFGASTPFELPEIARAEKVLLGFGLTGQRAIEKTGRNSKELRSIAGDIAAGTGQSFEDVSTLIGKFSSGATGEAISRFQELGIVTKEQLKGVGIEFDKAGSLTSPLDKALKATLDLAGDKFGGGMKALSNTFEGQLSTLSDNIGATFRDIGAPIFEVAKNIASNLNTFFGSETFGTIKTVIGEVLKAVAGGLGFVFSSIGAIATGIGKVVGFFVSIATTAATFAQSLQGVSIAGVSATAVFAAIGSVFDNLLPKLAGVGAAIQGVFAGDFDIAKNFKKGFDDAEKAAADAKIAEGIAAQTKQIEDRIKALEPALKRVGDIPFETDKLKGFSDQIEKLGAAGTTAVEKGNISEAIARQVPGALQGIKKIADENGNLVAVYDLNIKKVRYRPQAISFAPRRIPVLS